MISCVVTGLFFSRLLYITFEVAPSLAINLSNTEVIDDVGRSL